MNSLLKRDYSRLSNDRPSNSQLKYVINSTANESNDRRIGLNIQYIKPSMRQQNVQSDSALLVRGRDSYGHFRPDRTPPSEIPADAKQRLAQLSGEVLEITRKGSRL